MTSLYSCIAGLCLILATLPSAGTSPPGIPGWDYLGCADDNNPRSLAAAFYSDSEAMNIESCLSFCASNNYKLAGLEYSQECYCGNGLQQGSSVGKTGCNIPCSGNPNEVCGGALHLSVWEQTIQVAPTTVNAVGFYAASGCLRESFGRILEGPHYVNVNEMTVESCVAFCSGYNQQFAGLEYSQECWCGNWMTPNPGYAPQQECNMPCKGNAAEFCGGSGVLNLFTNQPSTINRRGLPKSINKFNPITITPNYTAVSAAFSAARMKLAEEIVHNLIKAIVS